MQGWKTFDDSDRAAAPPHLGRSLATLRALNGFVEDRCLRLHQDLLLDRGNFSVPCPFTGAPRQVRTGYLQPTNLIFYVFEGAERFGVVAERAGRGYPFTILMTEDGWAHLEESTLQKVPLRRLLRQSAGKSWRPGARPLAVVGHSNFAHGFWNEFPAFHLARRRGRSFDLATAFDPLLLFARYTADHGLSRTQIADPLTHGTWTDGPVTHLGAVYCGGRAKTAMRAALLGNDPPRPTEVPTVYVSVRSAGRTAVNQTEFLVATGRMLSRAVGGLRILVDGFSVPSDLDDPAYDALREEISAKVAEARMIAGEIADRLRALPEAPEVIDLTGLSLIDALPRIGQSHFYVTHAGTSHHKIGWLFPTPGVLHSNHKSMSPQSLNWHGGPGGHVARSRRPVGLPRDLVRTLDTTDMSEKSLRNMDYVVTDIDAAAAFITQQFLAVLGDPARAAP